MADDAWRSGIQSLLEKDDLTDDDRRFLKRTKKKTLDEARKDIEALVANYENNSRLSKAMKKVRPLVDVRIVIIQRNSLWRHERHPHRIPLSTAARSYCYFASNSPSYSPV
jgi:hypothetical protein